MNPQIWWYVARASGFVAWGLSVTAVVWGLALSTKALGGKPRPAWLLDLHRFLGGLTVVFVGVHLSALVADNFVYFGAKELFIPFASEWKPWQVAIGVIAFWALVAVEVSSLMMRRLRRSTWRKIHMASYGVAVLSTTHGFVAGTDSRNPLYLWAVLAGGTAIVFFTFYRVVGPRRTVPSGRSGRVAAGANDRGVRRRELPVHARRPAPPRRQAGGNRTPRRQGASPGMAARTGEWKTARP